MQAMQSDTSIVGQISQLCYPLTQTRSPPWLSWIGITLNKAFSALKLPIDKRAGVHAVGQGKQYEVDDDDESSHGQDRLAGLAEARRKFQAAAADQVDGEDQPAS